MLFGWPRKTKLRLYSSKRLASLFPLFVISAFASNLQAQNDLDVSAPIRNTIDLPSEGFLDFLASGIDVGADNKQTINPKKRKTKFIDPMEIQELDSLGLLTTLKLPSTYEINHTNNLTKENKE